jgi:uncharacterized membrane protein YfcA
VGGRLAHIIGGKRGVLNAMFAAIIFLVAIYMLMRSFLS